MEKPALESEVDNILLHQSSLPEPDVATVACDYDEPKFDVSSLDQSTEQQTQLRADPEAPSAPDQDSQQRNVDDLQLVAQLGTSLAPMIQTIAADESGVTGLDVPQSRDDFEPQTHVEPGDGVEEGVAPREESIVPPEAPAPDPEVPEAPPEEPQQPLLGPQQQAAAALEELAENHAPQHQHIQNGDSSDQVHDPHAPTEGQDVQMEDANTLNEQGNLHEHVLPMTPHQHEGPPHQMPAHPHQGLPMDNHHEHHMNGQMNQQQIMAQPHPHQPHIQSPMHPPYVDGPQQSQMHMPAQMQMYAGSPDNGVPPRKRSKVSRACDECRRKKVKCDAISETGETACSNCRRSQIRCDFSRIPQKRGPSKGYIKELADRINSIEGKLGNQGLTASDILDFAGGQRRESSEHQSPSAPLNDNSKRPFSSISTDPFSTPVPNKAPAATTWSSEPRPLQPYPPPTTTAEGQGQKYAYSANRLAPPLAPAPPPPEPPLLAPGPLPVSASTGSDGIPAAIQQPEKLSVREIDDNVFHGRYLTIVHPTFPFLASVKTVVQSTLARCPPLLREAFLEAITSTMQSFNAMPEGVAAGDARRAARLLVQWKMESAHDTLGDEDRYTAKLVHLQVLLLLAIEAENHGVAALDGQHGGSSQAAFLAHAVAVSYDMGLRTAQMDDFSQPDPDPESHYMVSLRAWWSLVALDRFNAAGTARPLLIPQNCIHATCALKILLGDAGFYFIGLCHILGNYVETFISSPSGLNSAVSYSDAPPINASAVSLGMDMWKLNFPASIITPKSHPVLHFAYWHCRLITCLLTPSSTSTELLWAATGLVQQLCSNHLALSPLNHHVNGLAGLCLAELSRVSQTREDAIELIATDLMAGSMAPSTWDNMIRAKVSSMGDTVGNQDSVTQAGDGTAAAPTTAAGATASQGLKHLADLAAASTDLAEANNTGAGGEPDSNARDEALLHLMRRLQGARNYEDLGFDPRPMLRKGYLYALQV
ncbi:hypothetical protein PpBr36_08204 [Pyricularia pennisetigena]|uniref:hypothetical protein n=1 Tax=Pyricularia pennisetigena TaxID=1578925 RepID=UPI0011505C49|nr:hypothetical protein PpBr36_08204 [Pyricularia pennisetigena]TLS23803.1 hypothetical protein PpBr36_08204 [Pyricularia pennisetigena]